MNIFKTDFKLSAQQIKKYEEWKDNKSKEVYVGAIGGAYSFIFTPTGVGIIIKVACADGTELDLTEWEDF